MALMKTCRLLYGFSTLCCVMALLLLVLLLLQYWKSNAMHWCELCRCWMNDTKAAKLNHERGAKHQENLARSEWLHKQRVVT
jgi:uncharacterized membrane protein